MKKEILCIKGPYHKQFKPYVGEKILYSVEGENDFSAYIYIEYGHKNEVRKFYVDEEAMLLDGLPGLPGWEQFILDTWDS